MLQLKFYTITFFFSLLSTVFARATPSRCQNHPTGNKTMYVHQFWPLDNHRLKYPACLTALLYRRRQELPHLPTMGPKLRLRLLIRLVAPRLLISKHISLHITLSGPSMAQCLSLGTIPWQAKRNNGQTIAYSSIQEVHLDHSEVCLEHSWMPYSPWYQG